MVTKNIPIILQLDGGIGRVLCATPAIKRLAERTGQKLNIITGHPDALHENPHVHKIYNLDHAYLWEDVVRHGEFINPEPYHNHLYYNQQHHLIQSFNYLINDKCEDFTPPLLYLSCEEKRWGEELVAARRADSGNTKPIVVLQAFGASASYDVGTGEFKDNSYRSLPMDRTNFLLKQLENDCIFINASHIPLLQDNVWQQPFTLRQLFSVIAACDFVVSVDSFASHAGAAFGKSGILFIGGTYGQNVGYSNYIMIHRDDYPKAYFPNRFFGFVDKQNEGALDFSDTELIAIAQTIRQCEVSNIDLGTQLDVTHQDKINQDSL